MNVLKNPSFFRPSSRPSSPAPGNGPVPGSTGDRPSRPSNKLSLSSLMRTSSSQPPGPTSNPAPLVQDGSYLEMLSLKLSEAVSKALAQPVGITAPIDQVSGKRPIPNGRGTALGALIASYVNFCSPPDLSLISYQRIECCSRPPPPPSRLEDATTSVDSPSHQLVGAASALIVIPLISHHAHGCQHCRVSQQCATACLVHREFRRGAFAFLR